VNTHSFSFDQHGLAGAGRADEQNVVVAGPKFIPAYWGLCRVYVYQGGMHYDGDAPCGIRSAAHAIAAEMMKIDSRASAENRHLSAADTSATVLPAMSEAGNQFSVHARDANEAAERGKRFLIGEAFLTVSAKEG
jgi:hypothetical protein